MPYSYKYIIDRLGLEPLPHEGGFFRQTYVTHQSIDLDKDYVQPLSTAIYFLLTPESFSALHLLKGDEVYHFYLGDPVELYELSQEDGFSKIILGQDLKNGQSVQHVVKANRWQGSQLVKGGQWSLLGTTMAPGFVWEDFELGNRDQLLSEYPDQKSLILELTREED